MEGSVINTDSIKYFKNFSQVRENLKTPKLTVSPRGNIIAQWKRSKDENVNLEFMPDGLISFVIFDTESPGINQIKGKCNLYILTRILDNLSPDWIMK